jgi:endonuclease YncB( thermonuclease family)
MAGLATKTRGADGGRVLSTRAYARLRGDLAQLIEAGRAEAESLAGHVLAVTYYRVGQRIAREGLSGQAGYGVGTIELLADELGVSRSTLLRAVQFARNYPKEPEPGLSWAHYRELLTLSDPEVRAFYESRAREQGWGKRQLRAAIDDRVHEGKEGSRRQAAMQRPRDASYLYRGQVEHVVDADTLVVRIDLGFSVYKQERVRLANVQAAEKRTPEGRQAAQMVRETLAKAAVVVLRTQRLSDAHGRYVAHVFYSGNAEASSDEVFRRGRYLNGELLEQGLGFEADPHF